MSDRRLRELERSWRTSGSPRDEAIYHAARLRHGVGERFRVQDLIKARVYVELLDRGADAWEESLQAALEAFERGEVLLIVGDAEVHGLETEIQLAPGDEVTWLHLPDLGRR